MNPYAIHSIVLALIVATVARYAASATGMASFEAVVTGIVIAGIAGALSWCRKPVAKVAGIGATFGSLGSIAMQLLAARQGTEIQTEYVLLFAALAGLLGVVGCGLWTTVMIAFRRVHQ